MELPKKCEYLTPQVEVVRINLEKAFLDSYNNSSIATSSEKSEVEWDF